MSTISSTLPEIKTPTVSGLILLLRCLCLRFDIMLVLKVFVFLGTAVEIEEF